MLKWRGSPGSIYHTNDISFHLVDKLGEESLIERTNFVHTFFVLNQERYAFRFANIQNSSTGGRNYKIRPLAYSFDGAPLFLSVYLGRH